MKEEEIEGSGIKEGIELWDLLNRKNSPEISEPKRSQGTNRPSTKDTSPSPSYSHSHSRNRSRSQAHSRSDSQVDSHSMHSTHRSSRSTRPSPRYPMRTSSPDRPDSHLREKHFREKQRLYLDEASRKLTTGRMTRETTNHPGRIVQFAESIKGLSVSPPRSRTPGVGLKPAIFLEQEGEPRKSILMLGEDEDEEEASPYDKDDENSERETDDDSEAEGKREAFGERKVGGESDSDDGIDFDFGRLRIPGGFDDSEKPRPSSAPTTPLMTQPLDSVPPPSPTESLPAATKHPSLPSNPEELFPLPSESSRKSSKRPNEARK